jgi:hypothetical protein
MKIASLLLSCFVLLACEDAAEPAKSASAKPTAPPPAASPSPPPSQSASADASAPVLPGTSLKEVLKETTTVMALSKISGPMGVMTSDKKDVAAIIAALGPDQTLSKGFGAKCLTPTKLAFQGEKGKQLGMIGFCDTDETFKSGRFDGSGAEQAAIEVKEPEKLKAAMKKLGALK